MTEVWRAVPGMDYEASSLGRVRRSTVGRRTWPGRILRSHRMKSGYIIVSPTIDGKNRTRFVHALVAAAFIGERPVGRDVNHKDGNKGNNAPENLEYATRKENMAHARAMGLAVPPPKKPRPPKKGRPCGDQHWTALHPERISRGESRPGSKLTAAQVMAIRAMVAGGTRQIRVAELFAISPAQVCRIVNKTHWTEAA